MRRPTYGSAVLWIALNDETAETDAERIAQLISVVLVADIFGVEPERVARDVLERRAAELAAESRL